MIPLAGGNEMLPIFLVIDLYDWVILGLLGLIVLYITFSGLVIVPKDKSCVVERFGVYLATWGPGVHYRLPGIYHLKKTVDFQGRPCHMIPTHQIIKSYSWPTIYTRDGYSIYVSINVNLQIAEPRLYVYGASSPPILVERVMTQAVQTLFYSWDWGVIVTNRSFIKEKLQVFLQETVNPWGIRINRFDLVKTAPKDLTETPDFSKKEA